MATPSTGLLPVPLQLGVAQNISNEAGRNPNARTASRGRGGRRNGPAAVPSTREPFVRAVEGVIEGNARDSSVPRGQARRGSSTPGGSRRNRGRGGADVGASTPAESSRANSLDRAQPTSDRPPHTQNPRNPSSTNTPAPSRRTRFNASLSTNATALSSASTSFVPPAPTPLAPVAAPANQTLLERLTHELTLGIYDCSICFSSLSKTTAIHSCKTCYTAFHLPCIEKWASRSCVESAERAAALASRNSGRPIVSNDGGVWRCPACQTPATEIPKTYTCFCTRVVNPPLRLPATPHSCGKQCARARPPGCPHVCLLSCHPGPCPPCSVVLTEGCHCGKKSIAVRCSAIHSGKATDAIAFAEMLSCHAVCDRPLGCGLHRCQGECHEGDCGDCVEVREKICYCGRDSTVEMCGAGRQERIACFKLVVDADSAERWDGEFSCDRICAADYDCKQHQCKLSCHPHTSPDPLPCPLSPSILTHCPCGTTSLSILLPTPRQSCLDAVPLCSASCPKLLDCGHACGNACHPGACAPCSVTVGTVCRCGELKGTRQCGLEMDFSTEILCEKVCRAMRNCGRHECGRRCCPLSFQEKMKAKGGKQRRQNDIFEGVDVFSIENDPEGLHTCERVCGRKLGCGIHLCAERDHKGPCRPCYLANFEELICHCGSTIMLPPIACNTTIDCRHPCIRPSACGHPQMPHACHETEGCPPCPFLCTKECACGKKKIPNVRCSSKTISCGTPCGKLLRCGFHRCKSTCHSATTGCDNCTQVCLKPLRHCYHPCPLDCHSPSACPTDSPCTFTIEVTCACGHLKQRANCASCDTKEEGNRERLIKCSDACTVKKRNDALAEALGIEQRERKVREIVYEAETMTFYSDHPLWCNNLEMTYTEFVNGDKPALHLPVMKRPARKFCHELAEAFRLGSEAMDEEPRRSIVLTRLSTSSPPSPLLADAYATYKKSSASNLTFGSLRKVVEKPLAMNALLFEKVGPFDEETLKSIVRPVMRGVAFTVQWISPDDVLLQLNLVNPSAPTLSTLLTALQQFNELNSFCLSIESVHATVDGVVSRGGAWTSVSGSGTATPVRAGRGFAGSNPFEALGRADMSSAVPMASTSASVGNATTTIVAAQLAAQIAQIALDEGAAAAKEEKEVPDDWEDGEVMLD